jgi:hypothetical protein
MEYSAVVWIGDRGYRLIFSEFAEMLNGEYVAAFVDHNTATIRVAAEYCGAVKRAIDWARESRQQLPAPKPKRRRKKAA